MSGFNKDYFAYYEDTDLSFRLREKGYKLQVIPQSKIWHVAGGSSRATKKKPPFLTFLGARNRVMFFRRHTTGLQRIYVTTYLVFDTCVDALFHLLIFKPTHAKEYLKGLIQGLKYNHEL